MAAVRNSDDRLCNGKCQVRVPACLTFSDVLANACCLLQQGLPISELVFAIC